MIQGKRKLQWATTLATSSLIVILGVVSGYVAASRLRSTMEQQMAEDSRVISENLRFMISQVTRELTDRGEAIEQVQKVLQSAQARDWRGFACIIDENGTVLAHPNPEMRGTTVSLETYEPTAFAGSVPGRVFELSKVGDSDGPAVYRSSSDIIAVQWLPNLMTYLCVHQPRGEVRARSDKLIGILSRIGVVFLAISAFSTWFFLGWLVDRYESTLAVSEARNRSLVQNSEAIIVVDDENSIRHTNPAASKLLGLPEGETEYLPIQAYWQSADTAPLNQLIRESRDNQPPREIELEILAPGGRIVPVAVRACKISYLDRQATYLLLRDVTENRRAREEILEANRKLKELDRLKSDFLNTVSHELRTPLTSIKWSTESLAGLSKNEDEETFNKLLRIIRDDNQRLTNLIEKLLSFSQLDAGRLAPKFERVELRQLAEKAILELSPLSEAKQIDVVLDGEGVEIDADREQIRLLITNLLDNAIKYSPAGSRVNLSTRLIGHLSEIRITDSGIGIKPDDLNSIFDRFFRSDTSEVRDEAGTGLGLSIVRGILDTHNGSIDVTSDLGKGSAFTVSIPLSRRDGPESS